MLYNSKAGWTIPLNLPGSRVKSDLAFGWNWCFQHLAESGKNGVKFGVVTLLHLGDLPTQIFVGGEHGTELQEGAHDGDIDLDRAVTTKNAGEHRHAMFCEGVWTMATATVNCQT